eukprot:Hpha_TRINITY_DN15771_c3_g1::TRINITY_DN15771_c3_g1_i1::g.40722::m.40722
MQKKKGQSRKKGDSAKGKERESPKKKKNQQRQKKKKMQTPGPTCPSSTVKPCSFFSSPLPGSELVSSAFPFSARIHPLFLLIVPPPNLPDGVIIRNELSKSHQKRQQNNKEKKVERRVRSSPQFNPPKMVTSSPIPIFCVSVYPPTFFPTAGESQKSAWSPTVSCPVAVGHAPAPRVSWGAPSPSEREKGERGGRRVKRGYEESKMKEREVPKRSSRGAGKGVGLREGLLGAPSPTLPRLLRGLCGHLLFLTCLTNNSYPHPSSSPSPPLPGGPRQRRATVVSWVAGECPPLQDRGGGSLSPSPPPPP